jgi:hypothetical protein
MTSSVLEFLVDIPSYPSEFFCFRDLIISSISCVVVYFILIIGNGWLKALCKYLKGIVLFNKLFLSFKFFTVIFSATVKKYLLSAFAITYYH